MNRQSNNRISIFMTLSLLAAFARAMVLEPRRLSKGAVLPKTSKFGSASFLAAMILKKTMADSTGSFDPEVYNELFYGVVTHGRKKELELFLIFMKTFQKDLSNKCKMAMLKGVEDIRTSGEQRWFLARCEFVAETVFRYLHTSIMFYNIEYIVKTLRILVNSETVLMLFEGEAEEERQARNKKFFEVFERVVAEATLSDNMDFVARRLDVINTFYGPHFMGIFTAMIDDSEYQLHRHQIPLNPANQMLLDWGFDVPDILRQLEYKRLSEERPNSAADDGDVYGVTWSNLYRFYGRDFSKPFYNVKDFHMFLQK